MAEQQKMVRVRVSVPHREGFPGYWSIQQFFPEGTADYDVPADKVEELKRETLIAVVEVPQAAPPSPPADASSTDATPPGATRGQKSADSPLTPDTASPTGTLAEGTPSADTDTYFSNKDPKAGSSSKYSKK